MTFEPLFDLAIEQADRIGETVGSFRQLQPTPVLLALHPPEV
jgi:hypothetical protein